MTRKPGKSKAAGTAGSALRYAGQPERINPLDGIVLEAGALAPLNCLYRDDAHGIFLYQGNCLEVLDAIAAKHPDGCFDMIFADPPYFLSNGGITCHAGKPSGEGSRETTLRRVNARRVQRAGASSIKWSGSYRSVKPVWLTSTAPVADCSQ